MATRAILDFKETRFVINSFSLLWSIKSLGSAERQHFYELSIFFVFFVFYHYFLAFTVAKRLHHDIYLLPSSFIRNLHYY